MNSLFRLHELDEKNVVSVLCATYRRPRLVANALACFLAQETPGFSAEILILDDGGELAPYTAENVRVFSQVKRLPSTARKYDWLAERARGDVLVVWDDDDVYLPWHLRDIRSALQFGEFSKPAWVFSDTLWQRADAAGRFHGTLGLKRSLLERVGGWPNTKRADWSLRFIRNLTRVSPPVDSIPAGSLSSYVYRRPQDARIHATAAMLSPADERWYERYGARLAGSEAQPESIVLKPQFDLGTIALYRQAAAVPRRKAFSLDESSVFSTP